MDPHQFSCPHCSTRLRVRDALSVGRTIRCPECGHALLLAREKDAFRVVAAPDAPAEVRDKASDPAGTSGERPRVPSHGGRSDDTATRASPEFASATPAEPRKLPLPERSRWRRRTGWGLVGGGAAALLGLWLIAAMRRDASLDAESPAVPQADDDAGRPLAKDEPASAGDSVVEQNGAGQRLTRLGTLLREQLEAESAFPPGTYPARNVPVETRLSWQARLADRLDASHPLVHWDKPWNEPVNEAFVRRRLAVFQNPEIAALTGGDGYPATHFVGVAGVGADAARLDAANPRAGIFGYDRSTRPEDVRDGLSNTALVLGVREHLGSWAAAGPPTVRGLTREPYVNGPDGFGTGQADSMLVLMADGSVRTFSSSADPRILRGLAAMADAVPGAEPSSESPAADSIDVAEIATPTDRALEGDFDDPPLEPEFAAEPGQKRIDIAASLRQPILQFEQSRPRSVAEMLPELSELLGAPIRYEPAELGASAAGLKTLVQVRLRNTTVGDILESLLKPAGLAHRVEEDGVRLVPRR